MRCQCCDKNLSDYESTARHTETGKFLDMCLKCLKEIEIPVQGRKDLSPEYDEGDDDFPDTRPMEF